MNHGGQTEVEGHDLALFVDASISTTTNMVGFRAVIFTANKRLQAALSKPLEGTISVLHAEALELLVGTKYWVASQNNLFGLISPSPSFK